MEPTLDLSTAAIAEHAHDSCLRIDALAPNPMLPGMSVRSRGRVLVRHQPCSCPRRAHRFDLGE
jgi:hypothetical protein